jgi:hypothetical protein
MKQFLTARDVEDLAAQGVRQIPVDADVILTDLAMERAAALGIALTRGAVATSAAGAPVQRELLAPPPAPARPSITAQMVGSKPKGCLHDHIESARTAEPPPRETEAAVEAPSGSVVDRLVEAVRRLSR